ncbi:hypothetical protein ACEQPO_21700 [Bacillus sp. SL00103]
MLVKAAEGTRAKVKQLRKTYFKMAGLRVPVVCIVIGEGGSGGALGLGVETTYTC